METGLDFNKFSIYLGKDGRIRVYDKQQKKIKSYPRLIMEQHLGRPLLSSEDVHHLDGNPLNNNLENLTIIDHKDHCRYHANLNLESEKWKNISNFKDKSISCPPL